MLMYLAYPQEPILHNTINYVYFSQLTMYIEQAFPSTGPEGVRHAIYPQFLWDWLIDRDLRIEHPWFRSKLGLLVPEFDPWSYFGFQLM